MSETMWGPVLQGRIRCYFRIGFWRPGTDETQLGAISGAGSGGERGGEHDAAEPAVRRRGVHAVRARKATGAVGFAVALPRMEQLQALC
eukprot:997796-Rhodomonas_salina.8